MAQVPDYQEFQLLIKRVERLERDNEELRSRIIVKEWLSREETMKILDVSVSTLWRLTKAGAFPYRYEGKRPFYEIEGLKNYLTAQKINPQAIETRVAAFC